ncbi:MAG: DEAD/DEAH box helicase [Phycisphaerales bacterium]|nr:DEAD/DEAH box helicase [Phycisphaerales bacterium]
MGQAAHAADAEITLRLPCSGGLPAPSTRLAHALGLGAETRGTGFARVRVPTLALPPPHAAAILGDLTAPRDSANGVSLGSSVEFYAAAARLGRHLLAQQRFIPALKQDSAGELRGLWQPWLSDERTAARAAALLATMPPVARAAVDEHGHQPWPILQSFLGAIVDAQCRDTLRAEVMAGAIAERDPGADPQVAWLGGLLDEPDAVPIRPASRPDVVRAVRRWIAGLEDRGTGSAWRLLLRLTEPEDSNLLGDIQDPGDQVRWTVRFHLQSQDNPAIALAAEDLWALASDSVTIEGRRAERPQETLLKEIARAARVYPMLERALADSEPADLKLSTRQAYQFLREYRPILIEQGFGAEGPEWWDQPGARLGARLKLFSGDLDAQPGPAGAGAPTTRPAVGLEALVKYDWEISIGGTTLSLAEFEQLASRRAPLIRINGRWVEVRPEDLRAAMRFLQENPGGSMRVGEAIRMAYGADARTTGIPIVGLEATGWVSAFFGPEARLDRVPIVDPPAGFHGKLRPYQVRGLSWLWFLERFGFGACLADDMGLGKTIQLLALLAFEREEAQRRAATEAREGSVPPTLLIVPMSVVGNWVHEARRFCPQLRIIAHHGAARLQGAGFLGQASAADAVITTYALAHRDRETLGQVHWQRVVLDEAQNIKNPAAKQTAAVRALPATTRVALTGTPVENRLSELWSIIDFLNPEYLGGAHSFRKRFAVPVERYRDPVKGEQLRELIRPFVLRRLKSDPAVAADLPPKVESKEYSHLTAEQAELYESLVQRMLGAVEASEGMQRRGLVLSTLIKLKQACNHPAQLLKDHDFAGSAPPAAARSGKCVRLIEMLDEVMQGGEQALVFTQFRQMASLLAPMLRHDLDREVLVLHGGTPAPQRESIVKAFQRGDGSSPILVVSLKAGGVGLNLTAATHVFHFDRWWNPAVENQATDRAHRIGQNRTVQVHKFVVRGTLEERIDEMIEQKTELAASIIGSGERWLTEMSTDQLRDILTLRRDAVEEA